MLVKSSIGCYREKFIWTEFFSFLDWWFWHCKSAFQMHPQTRFCGNRATNRNSGYWFSSGATTWFLQNPREHMPISVCILSPFSAPYPSLYQQGFKTIQAYLLFIKRLVDWLIQHRKSDLCLLLESPMASVTLTEFWGPHPGSGGSSTFGQVVLHPKCSSSCSLSPQTLFSLLSFHLVPPPLVTPLSSCLSWLLPIQLMAF